MRSSSALFLAAVVLGTIACSPAHAYDRRICLIGGGYPYPGDCAYDNYAQCKATASGQEAYCDVNPRYLFEERAGIHRKHTDGWNLSPFVFGGQLYQR
jgi:Protein of unknown function (DUF3551)